MKYSLGISNFLEEISSLSHSIVLLYFFALTTEEGFSCYSLELCIRCLYLSFSPLLFSSLLFTAICKASSESHFTFLHFFPWEWSWSLLLYNVRGATPCPMSGVVAEGNYLMPSARAVDKRSNPTFKVRTGDSSKVRSSSCALLEQPWRDTPHPR